MIDNVPRKDKMLVENNYIISNLTLRNMYLSANMKLKKKKNNFYLQIEKF